MILKIPNDGDRRAVAAILVANGYKVYIDKIIESKGKKKATVLVVEEREKDENGKK